MPRKPGKGGSMKTMQNKNRLVLFFACTFLLSWIVWLPGLLHAWGVIRLAHAGQTLVQIGAYAPTVIALLLLRSTSGPKSSGAQRGEELGWRGFALPRLLAKVRPISAAVVLGIIWSVWHLPQFFMEGTVQNLIPFYGYAVVTVYNSVFITILFLATGGSVFPAILYHLFSNFSYSLFPIFQTRSGQLWILVVFTSAAAGIVLGFRKLLFSKSP